MLAPGPPAHPVDDTGVPVVLCGLASMRSPGIDGTPDAGADARAVAEALLKR
jgi:hypothetical protein